MIKEFVFAEFLFEHEHSIFAASFIRDLGEDFKYISPYTHYATIDKSGNESLWFKIEGNLKSETATAIKLSDEFVASRMRISYIEDSLKDKYRS